MMPIDPGAFSAAGAGRSSARNHAKTRALALSIVAHIIIIGLLLSPLTWTQKRTVRPPAGIPATFEISDGGPDPEVDVRAAVRDVPPEPIPEAPPPIVAELPTTAADHAPSPSVPLSPPITPVVAAEPAHPQPSASAPAASQPAAAGGGTPEAIDAERNWERQVLARLERKKRYPAQARRAGLQDTVYLQIRVDRTGRVLARAIQRSRRFELLDAAALELVERAAPLPPPPPSVTGAEIDFVVPVTYALNEDRR